MNIKQIKNEILNIESRIKAHAKCNGISKTADDVGLKQPDISAWMNGKRNWSYEKILKIADKLGL